MVFNRKEYRKRPEIKTRGNIVAKERYRKNKEDICKKIRKRYQKNKVKIRVRINAYRKRLEVKVRRNTRRNHQRKNDLNYYLKEKLRSALYHALKHYSQTGKIKPSCEYGINYKVIIEHLKPFPKDVEKYHIDHIIPLSLFDFNNPEQIKIAFAPKNHQWLTKEQNLWKSNRLVVPCVFE